MPITEEQRLIELEKIRNSKITPSFWERVGDIYRDMCSHPEEFEEWIPEAAGGGSMCGICNKQLY